jgi:hypothetical protein
MFEDQFIENPPDIIEDPVVEKYLTIIDWIVFITLIIVVIFKSK